MPKAKRERRERTDNHHLIKQWCRTPEQRLYEGIRPVVLLGLTTQERALETGLAEHTLRRAADAFDPPHWAFRHRTDNRHTPAGVPGWTDIQRLRTSEELHRIFYATRFLCRLDRLGYAHFRRWNLNGEEALARQTAVIWLHGEAFNVDHTENPAGKVRRRVSAR